MCISHRPGIRNLPRPSIRIVPGVTVILFPTATMRPFCTVTDMSVSGLGETKSMTVACWMIRF